MIAGVCGGLAEYFDVDSTFIRLAVLFIFLFQGVGLIAYIIAWVVISEEPVNQSREMPDDYYIEEKSTAGDGGNEEFQEKDYAGEEDKKSRTGKENRRRKLFAVILIIIGTIFLLDIWIPALYWKKYWPLILIAAGLLLLKGDNDE